MKVNYSLMLKLIGEQSGSEEEFYFNLGVLSCVKFMTDPETLDKAINQDELLVLPALKSVLQLLKGKLED